MGRRRKDDDPGLTLSIIEDLKSKGYTQSEIARKYDVSRQYVSWIKHYYGGRMTPREQMMEHFPFQVPTKMGQTSPYRRLRDHGEYMATGGVGMDKVALGRLRGFYNKLRDQVLEFDPNIPPIPGVSSQGGWRYVPRTPEDGDLLIRVNEYTDLTDKGRMIWRFPPVEP
ncbi:transcriptional repressor [Mycobacterium phage Kimona]|uniref:Immunity repressor n=1 Tax=Mycobacterium phage Kimona TaxID=2024295 RepID=A0A249XU35_9CAUD|nr:transcriptional repressor [Mycobacterium phage Kimona]ASZ75505.1 immunity repressor [Mycobacterium phage Kimona]